MSGELIKAIARRILFLPVLRFVDDYFAADVANCAAHAMHVFARCIVRMSMYLFAYAYIAFAGS